MPFSPLELATEKNWPRVWKAAYDGAKKAGMQYKIVSISPGYDDTGLQVANRVDNPYRVVPRKNGATYESGMAFVETLQEAPDLIMISTFNEFHENTHIEPSLENGMRYIELTKNFIEKVKTKKDNS